MDALERPPPLALPAVPRTDAEQIVSAIWEATSSLRDFPHRRALCERARSDREFCDQVAAVWALGWAALQAYLYGVAAVPELRVEVEAVVRLGGGLGEVQALLESASAPGART